MRFALLICVLAAPAFADPPAPKPEKAPAAANDDCARARAQNKQCVLNIGAEEVEGGKPVVSDTQITFLKWASAQSLIHIRRDFIPEIVKTAEDL